MWISVQAAALALKKVPQCNSSWTNDYIRQWVQIIKAFKFSLFKFLFMVIHGDFELIQNVFCGIAIGITMWISMLQCKLIMVYMSQLSGWVMAILRFYSEKYILLNVRMWLVYVVNICHCITCRMLTRKVSPRLLKRLNNWPKKLEKIVWNQKIMR